MSVLGMPVFIVSGAPKVGKTSIAVKLAEDLRCPLVSFGDYVRAQARALLGDISPTRGFLQDLGQELVSRNPERFCREVLSSIISIKERPVVIDGLRHVALLPYIATLLDATEVNLIFVEASPEARVERWGAEITRLDLEVIDSHPVEADLSQIREKAHIIIDTQTGFEEACRALREWASRVYPSPQSGGIDEDVPGVVEG